MRTVKLPSVSWLMIFCFVGALVAGCGPQTNSGSPTAIPISLQQASPVVGTWTGKSKLAPSSGLAGLATALAGDQVEGPSTLTLQANGNGYLKVAKTPERAITWKQDGKKLVLTGVGGSGPKNDANKADEPAVATLSDDEKTMTIDLGQLTVTLSKSGS
jgi:hypothetical protein